ncbi:MAG: NADH-quinone oxidoreductase subunit C [Candidatus Amulumruptor caecigallinarius]|nr:NADH-quinone oxidoreductase subunit C [Candidatus Amulumruptor caecigallinarius]MCM1397598.1 NADH-quinone oxidoreductase subunit C [Candidatus Amulumruptor caecigallinarius]MCM1454102.1 NADH-quinone oxidoreductase subunit C [bacterium]
MANVQDKIAKLFPGVTFEEADTLTVTVDDTQWHDLAKTLRDDSDLAFDYLVTIVGMDWQPELGCIYYLDSTAHHYHIAVKVMARGDRNQPLLHSVSDLWAIAGIYEREVYDFFGIIFLGNPDMRRLFLSIDWKGYPLRKDYDMSPDVNPVPLESERQSDCTYEYEERPDGSIHQIQHNIFADNDFVVNIGPQHPATHGVLRFRTAVDGETIKKIDVYCGYIHRGVEKICEMDTYFQTLHFMDRLDYFSAHPYHHCLCMCIEKAAGIEVPRRAQVIRVLMDELSRIASHCLFIGTFCQDLGATTMLFYTLRVREQILDIMDKTCGARMTFNYETIGGVIADLDPDFEKDVRALLAVLPKNIKEYNTIFTGNVITKNRLENVGMLSREDAISWSVTGPSGRGSGWACDIRKTDPYAVYSEVEFDEIVRHEGDSMARFKVRMDEMTQSARIIEQCLAILPEGEIQAKVPKVLKLPQGRWFQTVEGCRGAFGIYIESDGGTSPYRLKIVPPCLPLASVVDHITEGQKIADLITIGGSLDYIVPDIDR